MSFFLTLLVNPFRRTCSTSRPWTELALTPRLHFLSARMFGAAGVTRVCVCSCNELVIHALGAAIRHGITLSLLLAEACPGGLRLEVC